MGIALSELGTRVLRKLKVLGEGQTAPAEHLLIVEQKLVAVHASLRKDERVRWSIQELPVAAEEPYVFMASFLAAPEFGQGLGETVWDWGAREITALIATPKSGETTPTEYF